MVKLTGYWAEFFKAEQMEQSALAKETFIFVKDDEKSQRHPEISMKMLEHLPNVKELIIHAKNIVDWQYITKLEKLRKLVLCADIDVVMAGIIASLPKLQELMLTKTTVFDADTLSGGKFTQLSLNKVSGYSVNELSKFTRLTALRTSEMDVDLTPAIAKFTKIKTLDLYQPHFKITHVRNLRFLKNLKKLETFIHDKRIDDDADLDEILYCLPKLKDFQYPIHDLSVIKLCPNLKCIMLDGNGCINYDALQDREIQSINVCDANSEADAKAILAQAQEYTGNCTTGYNCPWADKT